MSVERQQFAIKNAYKTTGYKILLQFETSARSWLISSRSLPSFRNVSAKNNYSSGVRCLHSLSALWRSKKAQSCVSNLKAICGSCVGGIELPCRHAKALRAKLKLMQAWIFAFDDEAERLRRLANLRWECSLVQCSTQPLRKFCSLMKQDRTAKAPVLLSLVVVLPGKIIRVFI